MIQTHGICLSHTHHITLKIDKNLIFQKIELEEVSMNWIGRQSVTELEVSLNWMKLNKQLKKMHFQFCDTLSAYPVHRHFI